MGLSGYRVVAGLAVSDMDGAVEFYEGKLGLTEWTGPEDNTLSLAQAGGRNSAEEDR